MEKETHLSDVEEQGYRGWLSKMGQAPGMGKLDKGWNHKSYDLRGVYKKYGPVDIRNANIPDEFKKSGLTNMGPDDTEKNWASKKSDSNDSANTSPWLADDGASKFDMGEETSPWSKNAQ